MIAGCIYCSGCSAVWLARLTGGQKVGGSNPLSRTKEGLETRGFMAFFFSWPRLGIAVDTLLLLQGFDQPCDVAIHE